MSESKHDDDDIPKVMKIFVSALRRLGRTLVFVPCVLSVAGAETSGSAIRQETNATGNPPGSATLTPASTTNVADLNRQLGMAVGSDSFSTISNLVVQGAKVNALTDTGRSAVHEAAVSDWGPKALEILLKFGGDINAPDKNGNTPLLLALESRKAFLMPPPWWQSPAAQNRVVKPLVNFLLKLGWLKPPFGPMNWSGQPLKLMAEWIFEHGGGARVTNHIGQTPLHMAAQGWVTPEFGKRLVKRGAPLETRDFFGQTPLIAAVRKGQSNPAQMLLALGARVDARDNSGATALHIALTTNIWPSSAIEMARFLLDHRADLHLPDGQGRTPAILAVSVPRTDALPVVQLMIQRGAKLSEQDGNGDTMLHAAIRDYNWKLMRWLQDQGGDFNIRNRKGESGKMLVAAYFEDRDRDQDLEELHFQGVHAPFFRSIMEDDREQVIAWINIDRGVATVTGRSGFTPLQYAGRSKRLNVVEPLLQHGAKFELLTAVQLGRDQELKRLIADQHPSPAELAKLLSVSIGFDFPSAARILAEAGADPSVVDSAGISILTRGKQAGWNEVVAILEKKDFVPNLFDAIASGDLALVARLAADKTVLNAKNEELMTPLHEAAKRGNAGVVAALVDAGADVQATNRDGTTALMYAAQTPSMEDVKKLLAHQASPATRDVFGRTALHWAAGRGRADIAELLLDSGAEPDAADKSSVTPLHYAAAAGATNVATLLISKGAHPDGSSGNPNNPKPFGSQDAYSGDTPLHMAALTLDAAMIEFLLANGAEVNARNLNGETPLKLVAHPHPRLDVELNLGAHIWPSLKPDKKKAQQVTELLRRHGATE